LSKKKESNKVTIYLDENDQKNEKDVCFDRHHRKPRCQGGKTFKGNISLVDRKSHERYNQLICAVAKYFSIKVDLVKSRHIAKFLNIVLPSIQRLMVDPKTGKIKNTNQIADEMNNIWLASDDPLIVQFGSKKELPKLMSAFCRR
jgi:hypothetical protein